MKPFFPSFGRCILGAATAFYLIIGTSGTIWAQATCSTPTNVSNFGVDGDAYANTPVAILGDSWFYSLTNPGSGIGVIGTSAATAYPAISAAQFKSIISSAPNVTARNRSYLQRMSVPQLSVINGQTMIDAFSARDNIATSSAVDSTAFTAGGDKNGDNPTLWSIGTGAIQNKNDIIDVGGHLRRQSSGSNDLWFFAFVTKLSTSGDSYTDIEIYRTLPYKDNATGHLTNTGPAATGGHTAFSFANDGSIAAPGDLIICINYSSAGGVASVRIWCNINNLDGNGNGLAWFNARSNRPFNFTGDVMTGNGTNGYGYAEISSLSGAGCLVYSVLNPGNTPAGEWGNLTGSSADFDTNIQPGQLVNVALNFTDFGLDFSTLSGPCTNTFGSIMMKSRSSSSYSSELKDYIGPFTFANFSEVQANAGADMAITCNASQVTLDGSSATQGAIISWYTPNGNIVSGSNTMNPIVNTAGTYIIAATNPTLSSCVATDTVLVTINNAAPGANAGSDKQITCAAPTVQLQGSTLTAGATFAWTATNGGNILSGANSASPVVDATGCYILTTTNTSTGCTSSDTACVMLNNAVPVISGVNQVNVGCYAACTGSISLTASGGQAPFAYSWSNGASVSSLSSLCAADFTVTVTGANGCTSSQTYTITQPASSLSVSSSTSQQVSCFGASNGVINATPAGGTGPFGYVWSNGSTSQSLSGVSAGTYTVTVTDANNCTATTNSVVTQPAAALNASLVVSPEILCYGAATGGINNTITGGTGPYTYQWNTGATTQNLSSISTGIYTVTVTDAHGCIYEKTTVVSQPSAPLSSTSQMTQSVLCFGQPSGSADVNTIGGTAPYSYQWNTGATTQSVTGLAAGTYTVTVTDANGCSTVSNVSVTQPSAPLASSVAASQNVSCNGGTNGSINLSVSGGTTPYTFDWSNGAATEDISGLSAGSYTVTITDFRGCSSVRTVSISQPANALSPSASASQNVLCFGGSNASVSLVVSGGTGPYTYIWNTGAITQNISGLSAGNYTATITDANGCISSASASVSQPAAGLASNLTLSQNVSCFGGTNGSLSNTVTGGTSPYTYSWSNGATTQNLSGVTSGIYTVTIADSHGCSTVETASIAQPSAALNASASANLNASCFGSSNGEVNLTVNGGTAPYTFGWSNGASSQDLSGLAAGSYTVTVTDANGCTGNASAQVTQPAAALGATIAAVQLVSCNGGNNGLINLSVTGGTSPYTYNWSNGVNTQNLNDLSAGTYTVTITDANGCTTDQWATITEPSAALATSASVSQQVSCFGGANGSVNLSVNGGTAPYTYSWSNGQSVEDLNGLAAGNYNVTVTDAHGCTAQRTVTVTQPNSALSSTASLSQTVSCNGGSNGQINLDVNGGTAPYSYSWSNGATSQAINGLSAGTYTVTVTDANGCTTSASTSVTQPSATLSGSITTTSNISCFSGNNGSIDLTVSGGTGPYTYEWNTGAISQDLSGLPAGNYSVTITDANGCLAQAAGSITQPPGSLASNLNVSQQVACYGGGNGALNLTVSGGTPPYNYVWSNGATSQDISNLPIGVYTVSVTDANGCVSSVTGSITQPSAPLSGAVNATQSVACFGGNDGTLSIAVNGGTAPYSYNWSNGATSQDINNLANGIYTVTITDANGCTTSLSGQVTQPSAALSATSSVNAQVSCFGGANGSVNLTVSGGTSPYVFIWSNGASTEDVNGLQTGNYSVTITDANGCNTSASAFIAQPSAAVNIAVQPEVAVSCFGGNNGQAAVSVSGGTTPYTYSWSTGGSTPVITGLSNGTYTVTVTDNNGCSDLATMNINQPAAPLTASLLATQNVDCFGGNDGVADLSVNGGTLPYTYQWSNGSTSEDASGLSNGTYTVTITDANGCSSIQSVSISQPVAALSASATVTANISCFSGNNGSIDLTVNGGTTPYVYQWSNGSSSEDPSGLGAGTYSVTITDANGCTTNSTATITQPIGSLAATLAVSQDVLCFGGNTGSLDLTVNGGTQPYTYAWSNGAQTEDISGLATGVYTVNITDVNGCITSQTAYVNQPAAALDAIVFAQTNAACFGSTDGTIDVTVTGGTQPYQYAWNTGASTSDLSGLGAGTYSLTVTDANGCVTNITASISQPAAALNAVVNSTSNVGCFGGNTGSIDLGVTGGTGPYSFAWNNGEATEDIAGLAAGTYSVSVTDANGCTYLASATITEPSAALNPALSITQQVNCFGGEDGAIDLTVTGGTQPYSYLWSTGDTLEDISNLSSGTYVVSVTDANGCTSSGQLNIGQPFAPLLATATVISNVFCNGGSNGAIDLSANGGTAPYTFQWSNGASTEDLANLSTGVYTATITDANGCSTIVSAGIGQPSQQLGATALMQQVLCFNGNNGLIDITPTGGTPPYQFIWNTGAVSEDLGSLVAGTYTVTISDANGCDTTITASIAQPAAPLIPTLTIAQNVSCFGGSNGAINLTATGGTLPYVYLWNNGAVTSSISGLPAGTYTVTVTDANGCNAIISDQVSQPVAPLSSPIAVVQHVSCYGGNNGSLQANASGGTAPYTYSWNTGATTSSINGLATGTYSVTVTDANGCTYAGSAQVTQPTAALAVSGSATIANCLIGVGGTVTVIPNGGTPPYNYAWSNGSTAQNLANASPGSYTVTVTDNNGCSTMGSYLVENNSDFNLAAAGPTTICVGETVTLMADTVPNGTYQWYFEGNPLNGANGMTFTTPAAGFYAVSVTVPCGTFFTDSIEVVVKSVENASITSNQIICPPEMVQLQATGGVTYEWTPAAFITFTNIPDPIVAPVATTTYSVQVTNEWGCKTTMSVDISVACDSLFIPNGFSPNDDGVNDGLVIHGIENYPGNKIWVYNRWGNLVYKTRDYANNWDGTSNVSGLFIGHKLPTGTYYYILDLNDNSKPRGGFLIIRR